MFLCALALAPAVARADEPLSFGEDGLRLGVETLYPGPVNGAAYDPAQELVWFRTGGTLEVIDLRDPKRTAVPIATRLPEEGAFAVTGASKAGFLTGPDEWVISYPSLATGKKVKLSSVQAGDFGSNGGKDADAAHQIKKAKLVGAKWLKTLAKRQARPVPPNLVNAPVAKVAPPDPDQCEEAEACGVATSLGNSKYVVVVTSASYGPGALMTMCHLYDPATKRFASPAESGTWKDEEPATGSCGPYHLSTDGVRYLVGSTMCAVTAKGTKCATNDERTYIGWADPAAP
jgi:hypothetical protein